ncbi:MAG: phytoene/squalene synthase family protein [Planctomycetes bacterium]|nr:phytoene/squalene synthase family protein [Planctomycetota bacterium]
MNVTVAESYAYCRTLAKRTAGNFYYSFLGLPAERFRAMCALYAFMRVTDDIGDCHEMPVEERARRLQRWSEQLRDALAGHETGEPVLLATADVVRRFSIPPEYLFATIDGVRMDLGSPSFETFEDLRTYCYHVAGAVGVCCIHIWGFRDEEAVRKAEACGLAFQLTNILRDLAEDAVAGRVYLPEEDLRRFHYTRDDLARHVRDDRFRRLMEFEVKRAREFYREAEGLFDVLEPVGWPILRAMRRIYGGLLDEIERSDFDVFARRISLPRRRKLLIAALAVAEHAWLRLRRPTGVAAMSSQKSRDGAACQSTHERRNEP